MGNSSLLGRRQFLLGVVPAATLGTLGVSACSDNGRTSTSSNYAPTYFNIAEWAFINAAVARLIPSEGTGPGGVDAGVPEFIDRQMELPYGHGAYFYLKGPFLENSPPTLGYQLRYTPREIYRLGIAAANSATQKSQGKGFAQLPAADQDRLCGVPPSGRNWIRTGIPTPRRQPGRTGREPEVAHRHRSERVADAAHCKHPGAVHHAQLCLAAL